MGKRGRSSLQGEKFTRIGSVQRETRNGKAIVTLSQKLHLLSQQKLHFGGQIKKGQVSNLGERRKGETEVVLLKGKHDRGLQSWLEGRKAYHSDEGIEKFRGGGSNWVWIPETRDLRCVSLGERRDAFDTEKGGARGGGGGGGVVESAKGLASEALTRAGSRAKGRDPATTPGVGRGGMICC